MKILVTGATGLIGRALCKRLRKAKHMVYAVSSDYSINTINPYEFIFHLGCYSAPSMFLKDPVRTIYTNTKLTIELLNVAIHEKSGFLFASSSEIYGNATQLPTPEDYKGVADHLGPRAAYTESKRMGETICNIYREQGVNVKVARLSSVYGPCSKDDTRVIPQMIKQAVNDREIKLLDQGQQRRTWLYVEDCVDMLLNIAFKGREFVYNVAGKESKSIYEMAQTIAEITDSRVTLPDCDSSHLGAPTIVQPCIKRYEDEFGTLNALSVKEGLRRTIEGMK
jgi:UDP-glucuronate decarboxylase